MKITNIRLRNFRCFSDFNIEFGDSFTVFIGKNGSGKSNLLAGIVKALSFMFSKDNKLSDLNTPGDSYIKKASFDISDATRNDKTGEWKYPIKISCNAYLDNESIDWEMIVGTKKGKVQSSYYKRALQYVFMRYNQSDMPMPLLAFFSDSYPHKKKNISTYARKIINAKEIIPRNFAYYDWDSETDCIDIWQKRYINCYKRINDFRIGIQTLQAEVETLSSKISHGRKGLSDNNINDELHLKKKWLEEVISLKKEIEYVDGFLKKFTETEDSNNSDRNSFSIAEIVVNNPEGLPASIDLHFRDNRKVLFDALPMGYRRILSIVFEIAYRSYILNKGINPVGIIIIDEIELHLHPSLANEMIYRLGKTFPTIQFILTTHAPQIITSIRKDKSHLIYGLEFSGNNYQRKEIENYFGADLETTLSKVMDMDFRSPVIINMVDSIKTFMKYNLTEEAEALKEKLIDYVGKNNAIVNNELKTL